MTAVLEKARGAAAFQRSEYELLDYADQSATRFVQRPDLERWAVKLSQLRALRSLEDDWDGEGSPAPGPELVDSALSLAHFLQQQGYEPPGRVIAGVNGTIFFEWFEQNGYCEIEVSSPAVAEGRWVQDGSDRVAIWTLGR